MSVRLRFALLASSSLLLLFFFQLASAQTDPAACSVSCRFVIVPTLGPQGLPGLNGTRGDTGDTGQRGPEGLQGPQGPPGIDGKDGINGTNGVDGQDATFDSTATYTGLKLEAPVLSGSISIDGAALTGSTRIDDGAMILQPNIVGAALTGSTSIGEGATILQPNITAPIIDGADLTGSTSIGAGAIITSPVITGTTSIGEGATILKPNITAPIIDGATVIGEGATLVKPKITSSELSGTTTFAAGATLVSPISTGLTRQYRTTIGPAVGETCRGNTTGNTISLVVSQTLPYGMWPGFGWNEIGSIVHWADGTTSTITDAVGGSVTGDTWGKEGTINDATVRVNADCKFYRASSHLLSDGFRTSVAGPLILHQNGGIVTLSTGNLPDRYKGTWNFPPPSPLVWGVTETDTFVGQDRAQTLTNKVLASVPSLAFKSTLTTPALLTSSIDTYYVRNFTTTFSTMSGSTTMLLARVGRVVTLTIPQFAAQPLNTGSPTTNANLETHERPSSDVSFVVTVGITKTPDPERLTSAQLMVESATGKVRWQLGTIGIAVVVGDSQVRLTGTTIQWVV